MKKRFNKLLDNIGRLIDKLGEKKFYKILIFVFLIFSLAQIFFPGITYGHDIRFHLSRIEGIARGLKNGVFPVFIYPDYLSGYGYASGIFYPDLFLYFPAFLRLLGLNVITCYKILIFIVTICIFASMYFTVKKITKSEFASTIVSILYLMSSYRITDMWIRLAFGETLTFVFLPIVILGLYEIFYGEVKNWKYFTIGLIGVVLSHLISGVLCLIVVLIFALSNLKVLFREKSRLKYLIFSGILSIGITMFFCGPLIEMMISDNFKYESLTDGIMMAKSAVNPLATILEIPSGAVPWVPCGIGIVFVYLFYKFGKVKIKDSKHKKFKNICIISGLSLLFASTSLFPWSLFGKILGILQFPWRFYILITILLLIGFSLLIKDVNVNYKNRIIVIITISFFSMFTYLTGTYYSLRFGTISNLNDFLIGGGEYIPQNVDIKDLEQRGNIITSNNQISTNFTKKGTSIIVNYENNLESNTYLELPLLYYHGYNAVDKNNEYLNIEKGDNGVIRVYINDKSGEFKVSYGITQIRKISSIVSIISLIIFIICLKNKKFE